MVKLDLEVGEIVGLAELGKIDEKRLKKFLKASSKEELEDYIIKSIDINNSDDEDYSSDEDDSGQDDKVEPEDELDEYDV